MSDAETIAELDLLFRAAAAAIEGTAEHVLRDYENCRDTALALNELHTWATTEEFETMFPTLEQFETIDQLDAHYGESREAANRAQQGLLEIAGWARAHWLAAHTWRPGVRPES